MKIRITLSDGSEWEELTYEPRSGRLVDSTGQVVQLVGRPVIDSPTLWDVITEGGKVEVAKYGPTCPSSGAQVDDDDPTIDLTQRGDVPYRKYSAKCPSCGEMVPIEADYVATTFIAHTPKVAK